MVTLTRSVDSGFSRKSNAPSLVASTAVLTVPCPEMMTTGNSSSSPRILRRTSMPSMPGILMSTNTRSGASRSTHASPACPLGASTHS